MSDVEYVLLISNMLTHWIEFHFYWCNLLKRWKWLSWTQTQKFGKVYLGLYWEARMGEHSFENHRVNNSFDVPQLPGVNINARLPSTSFEFKNEYNIFVLK